MYTADDLSFDHMPCFYVNGMSDAATEGHCVALRNSSRICVASGTTPMSCECDLWATGNHHALNTTLTGHPHLTTKKNLKSVRSHTCTPRR